MPAARAPHDAQRNKIYGAEFLDRAVCRTPEASGTVNRRGHDRTGLGVAPPRAASDEFALTYQSDLGRLSEGRHESEEDDVAELTSAAELATKNPSSHPNQSDQYRRDRRHFVVEEIELRRQAEPHVALAATQPPGAGGVG